MNQNEVAVNIPQALDPVYSNMIQIAWKDDEFTLLFLHTVPGVNQARAKAIVTITPTHAKNLLAVLQRTVQDYETKFGKLGGPASPEEVQNVTAIGGYS